MRFKNNVLAAFAIVAGSVVLSQSAWAFKVGIAMPTQNEERWMKDGINLKKAFEEKGYQTELFYGGDADVPIQQRQIPRLVDEGCDVLVIGAIDGSALTEALKSAKKKNIPVISYDRLLMDSDAVSYYATFDNVQAGQLQAMSIVNALNLNTDPSPKTIEFICGSLDDNNTKMFWTGAMDILKPYLDNGQLVCLSGNSTLEAVAIPGWSTDTAMKMTEAFINKVGYGPGKKKLDAIYSMADCLSFGAVTALHNAGYSGDNFPFISGQDATAKAINLIKKGEMGMTVFKDTGKLAERVVKMVDSIANGKTVEINDDFSYDNGTGKIKTYLEEPVMVDKDNYQKVVLDSGYITREALEDPANQ